MKVITHPLSKTYTAECPYCTAVLLCEWNDFNDKNKGTDMMPCYVTYCPICKGTIAFLNCKAN